MQSGGREVMEKDSRLLSLDALRGFDMLFIMGLSTLVSALCRCAPSGESGWLFAQMQHVPWEGLHHHDTIFPLFLFIAGISWPFSYGKQLSRGASSGRIHRKVLLRGLALVLLGLVYNGLFKLDFTHLRYFSVLGRIGLAWMFAALLYIHLRRGTRVAVAVLLLLGYWLLLRLVPAPDAPAGAGPFSMEGNLAGYIDRTLFAGHIYKAGLYDPEGLLGLIPATVTAMLGMFTGEFVRSDRWSGGRKTLWMLLASGALLGLGMLWSLVFPLVKALWSSSFVLVVGAYSLALFALFYWVIDVRGWKGWARPLTVVGLNSITIYMLQKIVPMGAVSEFFFGGLAGIFPPAAGKAVLSAGYLLLCWLLLYFLYRKKVFLKV